jgi:mono/diheme cytochrome c family protein
MTRRRLFLIIGLCLFLGPAALQAAPPAQAPETQPRVSGGRALWTENCQPCHGPTGRGDGPTAQSIGNPLPDLADPVTARQRTPADTFEVIKNGRIEKLMPPWGNRFDDGQIWDLAAYVWRLGVPTENLAAGETIYLEQCAACHGDNGAGGETADAPANMIDFTDLKLMTGRSQADLQAGYTTSPAHDALNNLSEEELWQALDYVRTFSFALPQQNGVLRGQVIDATSNQPVGNIEVTLYAFEDSTPLDTFTTQADEQGNYVFEKLPTEHSVFYVVEGLYRGVRYLTEPTPFIPDEDETVLDLNVYETTTSDAAVSLDRLNLLITFTPDMLRAIQLFALSNAGATTYIGQEGQTFAFALPENATNATFQDGTGAGIVETETGYASTEPVLPGAEGLSIAAIYDIPYSGDTLTLELPIPANVASVNVLMQALGAELTSDQLRFVETRQAHEGEFAIFSGGSLAEGESLAFSLSGLSQLDFVAAPNIAPAATVAPVSPVDQNLVRWVILGLGGVAIIAAGIFYPRFRSRLAAQTDEAPELRRQKLLLLLARLDDVFEAGELDEQVYRQARAGYKAELASIMKK